MLSHRPAAFDAAAENGVDLTLAGHTHGAQVGLFGRSLLEPLWPEARLWGHYRQGVSQLYTSSGVGHWFPFRLGCPSEAPVIELRRS
jgi:predicted MPP superfamily phosphohydrolase